MEDQVLILHLSELNFGLNGLFRKENILQISRSLATTIGNETKDWKLKNKPDIIIVTGDISSTARPTEYNVAESFFKALADELCLDSTRFIFVPGDHDVSRFACQRVELLKDELGFSEKEFYKKINEVKLENFNNFTKAFNENVGKKSGTIFNFNDFRLSIAVLNSCETESHRKKDHYGFISGKQSQELIDQWRVSDTVNWVRIVAMHHDPNFIRGNLKNALEDCHVQLVLHGNAHKSEDTLHNDELYLNNLEPTVALSTGNIRISPRGKFKNKAQLISINLVNAEMQIKSLLYDPQKGTEFVPELTDQRKAYLDFNRFSANISENNHYSKGSNPRVYIILGDSINKDLTKNHENIDISFDSEACEATINDIDKKAINKYIENVKKDDYLSNFSGKNPLKNFLNSLALLEADRPTKAAMLIFGKDPQKYFPQATIKCARFEDLEATDIIDSAIINGNLMEQIENAEKFILRNISKKWVIENVRRNELWEYPPEAIREALANAIVHRDYNSPGSIQVRIFKNKIEIWSPGYLLYPLNVSDLKHEHISLPRNRLIANCFYKLGFMEQFGTGIQRMIKKAKEYGLPDPEFSHKSGCFVVTLNQTNLTSIDELKFRLENAHQYIKDYETDPIVWTNKQDYTM